MLETLNRARQKWINPATTRGAVLVVVGLIILAAPDVSEFLLRLTIGFGAIGIAIADAWAALRLPERASMPARVVPLFRRCSAPINW